MDTPHNSRGPRPSWRRVTSAAALTLALAACKGNDASAESATPAAAPSASGAAATAPPGSAAPSGLLVPQSSDTVPDTDLIAKADAGRIMGKDAGAMWVIVISDFQCPYCKQWHDSTFAALKRDYVDRSKVRLAYLNLPLQQHPHAMAEAEAGLCAGVQGKFWQYADGLFHEQAAIGRMRDVTPLLDSLGRALSLDMAAFAICRRSRSIRALVQSDIQQATGAGVRSTPSFLVGDFLVQGVSPYADFRRALDTALIVAKAKGKR